MSIVNHSEVDWGLGKLDWDMVLRHKAAMAQTNASMANAAMYSNASMQNANVNAQSQQAIANQQSGVQMRGQDLSQQNELMKNATDMRGQDVQSRGQDLQNAAAMAQVGATLRGQDFQNQWENNRTAALFGARAGKNGLDPLQAAQAYGQMGMSVPPGAAGPQSAGGMSNLPPQQQDLLTHQMNGQSANAVLNGPNPQAAWSQYYNAMQLAGKNTASMGLGPVANANAMLYMGNVMHQSNTGINSIIGNGADQKQDNALEASGYKSDLDAWNKQSQTLTPVIQSSSDIPVAQQAIQQLNNYAIGTGPGYGYITGKLAQAGDKLGDTQASAAANAYATVNDLGAKMKILQRPVNAKAFNPTENALLSSMTISPDNTLSENQANLNNYGAFVQRTSDYKQMGDAWMNQFKTADGFQQAYDQYKTDNPLIDPKTRQPIPVQPGTWQKYVPGYQSPQDIAMQQQQAQAQQPQAAPPMQNIYGPPQQPMPGQNPYM